MASKRPINERLTKWAVDPNLGTVGTDGEWSPCHLWTGAITTKSGYGNIEIDGKCHQTHRVSYALTYGSIPDGMVLDHLCSRRACGNPLHLDPVTQRENVRRGASPVGKAMRAASK